MSALPRSGFRARERSAASGLAKPVQRRRLGDGVRYSAAAPFA